MPKYFGFEAVGALVYNKESGNLFSDPESQTNVEEDELPDHLSDDDDDARLGHNTREAMIMPTPEQLIKPDISTSIAAKQKAKSDSKKVSDEPMTTAQRMEELHKQQAVQFINFPANIGLSGQVFTNGNIIVCNDAEKESGFVDEIDNQPKVRNVRNFMIGPVYGEQAPGTAENQPNGIIQFINKKGESPINENDKKKFMEICELIGMCIQNTNNVTKTIGVTLKLNSVMERITNIMQQNTALAEEASPIELLKDVGKSMKEIKDQTSKLLEQRIKNAF